MGAGKELWMNELEQIGDRLAEGYYEREDAIKAWMRLGLDRDEAEAHAAAALGEAP